MTRFSRYLFALAALLLMLAVAYAAADWRWQAIEQRPQLPVAFEHLDHSGVACADCHHNFIDDSGGGACYNCHKMSPEIRARIEPMFHDFCRGCHLTTRMDDQESGPIRECSLCHH